jgi:hypothetical protein
MIRSESIICTKVLVMLCPYVSATLRLGLQMPGRTGTARSTPSYKLLHSSPPLSMETIPRLGYHSSPSVNMGVKLELSRGCLASTALRKDQ